MKRDTVIQIQYSVFTNTLTSLVILLGGISIFGEIENSLDKFLFGGSTILTLIGFILVFYLAHLERTINWKKLEGIQPVNLQNRENNIRKITYWVIGLAIVLILVFIITKLLRINSSLAKSNYNFIIPFLPIFTFRFPIDLLSAIAGGIVGLILVEIWDKIKKPKVKYKFFRWEKVNFGYLLKIHFMLIGKQHPGICQLEIKWDNKSVLAKWDESPAPLEVVEENGKQVDIVQDEDGDWVAKKFLPHSVPATYYQPLFLNKEYAVPILYKKENGATKFEIFSGWWFGRKEGYGPDARVTEDTKLTLILSGNNFEWREAISIKDILKMAKS